MAKMNAPQKSATMEVRTESSSEKSRVGSESVKLSFDEYMMEASSRLQYQMDMAQSLLRALTLGNGGAIIALLTFIGNTDAAVDKQIIWWSFLHFGAGLVGVFCGYIGGFFSQNYFYVSTLYEAWNAQAEYDGQVGPYDNLKPYRLGNIALGVGIASAILSLIGFIAGSLLALTAIT